MSLEPLAPSFRIAASGASISVAGELDLSTILGVVAAIRDAADGTPQTIELDLSEVVFVDAYSIRRLETLADDLRSAGTQLKITTLGQASQRLLSVIAVIAIPARLELNLH